MTDEGERERMDIVAVSGGAISEAETQLLLDDVVAGFADSKGRPTVRSKSGLWKSASFILGVDVAERFAYNGIFSNLISYLTGPLGQSTAAAAANVNAWNGTALLLPLLGAFVADSFLGRYRTIIIAVVVYTLSLGFLSLSAALHSDCKIEANNLVCSPPPLEVVFFYISLYLAAFAEGGMRPCIQAFGADQFDDEDANESKEQSSFFNWWYFSMAGGSLLAPLILNYIQENLSWELGFGIPCFVMFFALLLFLLGSFTYRFRLHRDEKNPFVRISRVFMNALRNRHTPTFASIEDRTKFKFLDKAVVGNERGEHVCSMRDVADAKEILKLLPVWFICLGYAVVLSQASTLFTKQGNTMNREIFHGFEIPAATLQSLINLSIVFCIPIYDRVLVPIARSITKKPSGITILQRVGTGLFLSFLSMIIAALVEMRRLATAAEYGLEDEAGATVPMSVWWLAPQYVLFGVAEVFVIVGLQELFYDQVPSELKSIGLALYLSILGIGSFLSSFLIFIIETITSRDGHDSWFSNNMNRAHLDYFYWLLAGLSVVVMAAFACIAKSYVYKRRDMLYCS